MYVVDVLTRGRKHIGSTWSNITCLDFPLAASQGVGLQAPEGSQNRRIIIATENKQYKENK
jgi:hypothetical protein